MISTTSKYHIRDYKSGDEQAIITLFKIVFGASLSISQWQWKYQGTQSETVYAKVIFNNKNELIGHAGAIPLQGYSGGKQIPFFQICDVMIHPDHRGYLGSRNLFTRLLRDLLTTIFQRFPEAFCYGFPGRRPFLLGKQAKVYDMIETAIEITRRTKSKRWHWLNTKPLAWNDSRLDRLSLQSTSQYALLLRRDRLYLQWRYADNPFFSYQMVGFFIIGKLTGWAIIRQKENRLLVIDILIARHWLDSALVSLDRIAAQRGADSVHIWLPDELSKPNLGKPTSTDVIATHMTWKTYYSSNDVRRNLYYTMGDLDIF